MMRRRSLLLWGIYALFAGCALYFNWHDRMLDFGGPLAILKLAVWGALLWLTPMLVFANQPRLPAVLRHSFRCDRR